MVVSMAGTHSSMSVARLIDSFTSLGVVVPLAARPLSVGPSALNVLFMIRSCKITITFAGSTALWEVDSRF